MRAEIWCWNWLSDPNQNERYDYEVAEPMQSLANVQLQTEVLDTRF